MAEGLFVTYVGLIGLAVGSFLNVVIDRLPRHESLVYGQSHCDVCHRKIAVYDLVPVLNYLWLRGRCRYCGALIPLRVPVVEAITGLLFTWSAFHFGVEWETLVVLVNLTVLIVIFFIDLERRLILNSVLLVAIPAAFVAFPWGTIGMEHSAGEAYLRSLAGLGAGFGILLGIYLVSRGGMGEGDVKMGALMGAAAGFPGVVAALLLAFVAGGAVAVTFIALRGMKRKDMVPFGPFLAAATVAVLLVGEDLYSWYLDLLSR